MNVNGHILIIDDEASLRQTLARILQRAGFEVTTAANGHEALSLVSVHTFDLIYLDIRMPDMNGLDVLTTIHTDAPDIPVILFTAQPDLHSAVEALRRGAKDYLLKPLKPQTVIDRTKEILEAQQIMQRKRELQRQMDILRAEINTLEKEGVTEIKPAFREAVASDDRFLKRGSLTLDLHTRHVMLDEHTVNLPPTSFDYLLALTRHAPNIVDYQTLVSEAQGYEADAREAQELTKWHVHHIRQAIEKAPHKPTRLINVRGRGYRLVVD